MLNRNRMGPHWWHGKFKGCSLRITAGRDLVVNELSKTEDHLSAEDIYMKIHPVYPSMGLTSIYRTLELLVNLGLVYKFDFGDGRARYELAGSASKKAHHHHLVCKKCKRIIDYKDFIEDELELLKKTEKGLSKKYGFEITDHEIMFYGICEGCKKSGN